MHQLKDCRSPSTLVVGVVTQITMQQAGLVANAVSARHALGNGVDRKAANTRVAYAQDLATFADYLAQCGVATGNLLADSTAWLGIDFGLVDGFVQWLLQSGYALATVNRKLSTVKKFVKLGMSAGVLSADTYVRVAAISGYGHKEGNHIDANRTVVRLGNKKAETVEIDADQASAVKLQPATPQGRRDQLLMCLLLDHGLRVGEVTSLQVGDFDLKRGTIRFYRQKVDKTQKHKLSKATLKALQAYMASDAPAVGLLLRGSRKGGKLDGAGLSTVATSERVGLLFAAVGLPGASAHDCRHYWATHWATKVDILRLQEAGGWSSMAMPRRYVKAAEIANEGME